MTIGKNKDAMNEINKISKKYTKIVKENIVIADRDDYSIEINGEYTVLAFTIKNDNIPKKKEKDVRNDLNKVLDAIGKKNIDIQKNLNLEISKISQKYIK